MTRDSTDYMVGDGQAISLAQWDGEIQPHDPPIPDGMGADFYYERWREWRAGWLWPNTH